MGAPAFTPAAAHEDELLARLVVEVGAAFRAVPVEHDQAQLVRVGAGVRAS